MIFWLVHTCAFPADKDPLCCAGHWECVRTNQPEIAWPGIALKARGEAHEKPAGPP